MSISTIRPPAPHPFVSYTTPSTMHSLRVTITPNDVLVGNLVHMPHDDWRELVQQVEALIKETA